MNRNATYLMAQPRYLGPEPDPNAGKPPEPKPEAKLTQAEVDDIVKKRLGEASKKFDSERAGLLERQKALETDAAKAAELQAQIDDLNNRYKSKEELAADALKKERNETSEKLKKASEERDTWRKKFEDQTLVTQLQSAASKKAKTSDGKDLELHNPNQFVAFIKPLTRLADKIVDGKPTGEFETRVKISIKGKELDLSPEDAVKAASEDPEYHHWFKSGIVGGLGANGGKQGGGADGLLSMPQETFTKKFLEGSLPKRK